MGEGKKSKKSKREKDADVIQEPLEADVADDTIQKSKSKKKKKDKDRSVETSDSLELQGEENDTEDTPKSKKKKRKQEQSETDVSDKDSIVETKPKKKKKEKEILPEESSLGVVDKSALQQAGTNLGLPLEEEATDEKASVKKEKKKKKTKEEKNAAIAAQEKIEEEKEGTRWSRCLHYLRLWSKDRDSWRFKKASQVQLLQIMYDKSKMSDDDFDVMLEYLEEIQGKGRDKTKDDAEKLLKDDPDAKSTQDPDKAERARQVFQLLS